MKTNPTWLKSNSIHMYLLSLLRIAIGWHFLYEGIIKLISPGWSAYGYLVNSRGFMAGFFQSMGQSESLLPVVNFLNTWDFTSESDSLTGVERLLSHIGNFPETPKGIMHGDNTGMYSACRQMAEMYNTVNQSGLAKEWNLQGDLFLQRTNNLCWNGKFYAHFIPEDPVPVHIKTDPVNSIGLSNTYSMNRGSAIPLMAASIIDNYIEIGKKTSNEYLAPWFGIYPFIEPHFGKYKVGEYMNGAMLPLVGGELAKAAFRFGYETYGVEQLKIAGRIMAMNNGSLPGCVNNDGTAQKEAVPDEWGQTAFVSALVEGLAGVIDKGIQFNHVEISPRWYFAGIDKTNVQVGYGNDGNQVHYTYSYKPATKRMEITTEGSFEEFTLRVPFPENTRNTTVTINGRSAGIKYRTGKSVEICRCKRQREPEQNRLQL